jgi:hypothetical protein
MTIRKTSLAIATIALTGLAAMPAQAYGNKRAPSAPQQMYQTGGQWMTTPDGCSYSRTQAPGYPPMWVLILNPHHIGQPNAHARCAPVLRG